MSPDSSYAEARLAHNARVHKDELESPRALAPLALQHTFPARLPAVGGHGATTRVARVPEAEAARAPDVRLPPRVPVQVVLATSGTTAASGLYITGNEFQGACSATANVVARPAAGKPFTTVSDVTIEGNVINGPVRA